MASGTLRLASVRCGGANNVYVICKYMRALKDRSRSTQRSQSLQRQSCCRMHARLWSRTDHGIGGLKVLQKQHACTLNAVLCGQYVVVGLCGRVCRCSCSLRRRPPPPPKAYHDLNRHAHQHKGCIRMYDCCGQPFCMT